MRNFDFYEFTAVLIPGTVLLFGISRYFPDAWGPAFGRDISASEFGLFVLMAYIAGQLIQGFGKSIEDYLWPRNGGLPTNRVLQDAQTLLNPRQRQLLTRKVAKMLELAEESFDLAQIKENWFAVTRQIYAAVAHCGMNSRVDIFNASYGMFRNLLVSFPILLGAFFISAFNARDNGDAINWMTLIVLLVSMYSCYKQMIGFGTAYGRELFVQFLETKPGDEPKAAGGKSA